MGIALMPHIPDNLVFRSIKNIVKGDGQFNDSEVRRKVTSVLDTTPVIYGRISSAS